MPHDFRPARAPSVRGAAHRSSGRAGHRAWRRRSRRAQVSAVATILGLLLVVTFIANYISTTLPNTMGQNELEHEITVQNQVGQLSALLQLTAEQQVVGVPVSQAVTLGGNGAPPFAGQDPSTITPLANQTGLTIAFTLTGTGTPSLPVSISTRSSSCIAGFCAGTGFDVVLHNTYTANAEVAFEQGAVVYAQQDSIPQFIVPPRISFQNNVLKMFLPRFSGTVNTESGVGTADVSLRLLSAPAFVFPSSGFSFVTGSSLTITIVSAYAAGWYAYFETQPTLASDTACSPSSICNGLYNPGNAPGTVTITIPTASLNLALQVGLFSFALY